MKIAHFGDLHIFNETTRHEEYRDIYNKIYIELNKIKPDRIVICGDLFESKLTLTNESKILAGELLNNLASIAPVKITVGNHDLNYRNLARIDSVDTIVKLINNPNVEYFNKTGMYIDGQITWVVYHHPEKNINPWLNQIKDPNQIYIGLFHDPVYGSSTDIGKIFNDKKYKDISYFSDNNYVMLADIHKRQYFRPNKSAAYCGSTIQKDFGESLDNHGFLLWKIKSDIDFDVEEFNIPNDHAFINLYLDESTDYDNLKLNIPSYKYPEIKIHWKDYSSNISTTNERKIRDYIKTKFNIIKLNFDKTYIYNDVISSNMLSESLDLSDPKVQTTIFKEYLSEQKYKKEDIDEILKIDDIINNRLHLNNNKTNIEWAIDKFWFNNFKSYGDNNEIDWSNINGIIQLNGLNKNGKTTILDAITYILYGKTTTTLSPEKFGDSRYINNKRQLDYCSGGAIIDVNGEKFVIERRTERIWNKNKTQITACPTTLDFYKDENINEANKLTGEIRLKTQDTLNLILGDLKDFIRLSFTNSDNLNDGLSETRSVFIDNIIRDAGYDIFEYKLDEFKEYKKEQFEEKLIVDIQDSETKIAELKITIEQQREEINSNKIKIDEFESELSEKNANRDDLNKKLNNIDLSMMRFDENVNLNTIENYKNKIGDSKTQITDIEKEIETLPMNFDITNLNVLKSKLKETNDKISERKEEISKIKNIINEQDNNIDKVLTQIQKLKDNEIQKLKIQIGENDLIIEKIKRQKENIINEEINNIKSKIQKLELEKGEISNNMKLLQKDGILAKTNIDELDKEIEQLKNSSSCPTCGREYDKNDEHLEHLEENINRLLLKKEEKNIDIQTSLSEYKKLKNLLPDFENKESKLNIQKNNLKEGIFTNDIKEKFNIIGSSKLIKKENDDKKIIIDEINSDNFENISILKEKILKGEQLIKGYKNNKEDNFQIIKNIESELKNFNIYGIENDIELEENKREKFESRGKKIAQRDNFNLSIENFNFKIKELHSEIDKYQEFKFKIEENKEIQFSIDHINEKIIIIKEYIKDSTDENIEIEKDNLLKENEINIISTKITKYLKQKKKEELYKEYQKCIGRDGIPTFLLKKSIHLINKELNDLLTNVDFTLFFDEELVLRMSMDERLDVNQSIITGSGMERTFCALALKIALRQINVRSKSNFIILDEIMGKLISDSIQQFSDFLDNLKTKVNKIVIIEHNHSIDYQAIITVQKDINFISSLSIDL